jgi:uncharacterized protein YjbJ (UPF0337 family)
MGHNIQKGQGKMKKNAGKISGNRKMEAKGAIEEGSANLKDKF